MFSLEVSGYPLPPFSTPLELLVVSSTLRPCSCPKMAREPRRKWFQLVMRRPSISSQVGCSGASAAPRSLQPPFDPPGGCSGRRSPRTHPTDAGGPTRRSKHAAAAGSGDATWCNMVFLVLRFQGEFLFSARWLFPHVSTQKSPSEEEPLSEPFQVPPEIPKTGETSLDRFEKTHRSPPANGTEPTRLRGDPASREPSQSVKMQSKCRNKMSQVSRITEAVSAIMSHVKPSL